MRLVVLFHPLCFFLATLTDYTVQLPSPSHNTQHTAYNKVFNDALFKPMLLKVRAKEEKMPTSEEMRLKCAAVAVSDLDFAAESQMMLAAIAAWDSM